MYSINEEENRCSKDEWTHIWSKVNHSYFLKQAYMSDIDGISHCKTHDIIEQICTISITKQKCFIMFNVALLFMNIILLFKLCIHQDDIVMRINKNNKITRTYRKLALNMNSSSRTKALAYIVYSTCLSTHIHARSPLVFMQACHFVIMHQLM